MSTRPNRRAYRARYVFPLDSPPVPDGVITVEGRRIVAIGENRSGQPPQDLGQVAVLPGLINAHTHLEFSDLAEPLGEAGAPFSDWIAAVVAHRRSADTDPEAAAQRRRHATQQGLIQAAQRGVTALGEIATGDWPADLLADSELDCTVFLELLGLSEDRVAPLLEQAARHLDRGASQSVWRAGLSPHAPYTVHPRLLEQAVALSAARQVPLAMHLAESFEELELLRSASGPLRQLLADLGAWDPTAIPRGIRPGDYLQILARAHRALVIHGNFLTGDEIGQIAAARDRLSVVYCPRTHARFVPGKYPLAEMLAAGVHVALGTDSRA
jgi:cytosine/adenosine deaminase-related metal-dependent hydrolase